MPASPIFCDAHTHLDQYEQFDPAELPGILQRSHEAGVGYIVLAGTTMESTERCIALADEHPMFYAGVGIHPMHAYERVDDDAYARLESLARDNPRVVCISEVGLDYLPDSPDHEVQDQVFRQHIHLAKSLGLPVIFHSRESHPEVFKVLREENAGQVGGAMHYFQGDAETARAAIECGFYISLARPLTRLPELREVARNVPLEHIVLETDAYPAAVQEIPTQLDGTPAPGRGRAVPGYRQGNIGGGSGGGNHRQPEQLAAPGSAPARRASSTPQENSRTMTTQHEHPPHHEAPEQIVPQSLNDYLEVMTKARFPERYVVEGGQQQVAGLSGRVSGL